jgi:hypothetical protein
MRAEYEVRELPDTFVTYEKRYSFVEDEKAIPDRYGRKRQKMVEETVESRGGWVYVVRGKPGHSIRLTSRDQMETHKLSPSPRMIDDRTGEEVDNRGIPLSVSHLVGGGNRVSANTGGKFNTEVDVTSNGDDDLAIEHGPEDRIEAPSTVLSQIDKLE